MSRQVNPALIASIPDPSTRQAFVASITDYQWSTSTWAQQVLNGLDEKFVIDLVRKSNVNVARAIAKGIVDPGLLARIYRADRRATVRSEISQNAHTDIDLVLEHLASMHGRARSAWTRDLASGAAAARLLELMSKRELRDAITCDVHERELGRKLLEALYEVPISQWVAYLGTGDTAVTLLWHIVDTGIGPEEATELLENYPLDPDLSTKDVSDLYSRLALYAVKQDPRTALAAYERAPRLETAIALLREHPHVEFGEVAARLEESKREALTLSICRGPYVLTADLADSLIKASSNGRSFSGMSHPIRVAAGTCEAINATETMHPEALNILLRAIVQAGTPEQIASVLNGPHGLTIKPQQLQNLQRRPDSDLRATIKHLTEGNPAAIAVLAEYLRRLNVRSPEGATAPTRDMTAKFLSALRVTLAQGTVTDVSLGSWAPLVQTKGDVHAVIELARNYPDFQVPLATLALHAVWWEGGGRNDTTVRKRALLLAETATNAQGSPHWDVCPLEQPRALVSAPPALAPWMQQHTPRAVEFLMRPLARRRTKLNPLQQGILPEYPMRWAAATDSLFEAAGTYLAGELTRSSEWQAATVLLQEWNGKLADLARAARVLSHA